MPNNDEINKVENANNDEIQIMKGIVEFLDLIDKISRYLLISSDQQSTW